MYGLCAALLIGWELVGLDLGTEPITGHERTGESTVSPADLLMRADLARPLRESRSSEQESDQDGREARGTLHWMQLLRDVKPTRRLGAVAPATCGER